MLSYKKGNSECYEGFYWCLGNDRDESDTNWV
jgi:hypothetical protein